MPTIEQLHKDQTGKISDKWSSYLSVYDSCFAEYKDRPLNLLEVGVQNGGSLEVWSKYFTKAQKIIGCDINPDCVKLVYDDKRISVVVGDANAKDIFERIKGLSGSFDIIIDDGSHDSRDIIKTFLLYFPLLAPGGIFVVEDTHTLYWKSHHGGMNKRTAMQFFKLLVDQMNYEHWRKRYSLKALFRGFYSFFPGGFLGRKMPAFLTEGWFESIEFRNSLILVRKSAEANFEKLGKQLIVGTEAVALPKILKMREELHKNESAKSRNSR